MIPVARQEALAWAERLKTDRSSATLAELEAWLEAKPENRAELEQQGMVDVLLLQAGVRADPVDPAGANPERAGRRWLPLGIAAGALAAAAAAALIIWPSDGRLLGPEPKLIASVDAALTRPVRLQDGTLVILAASAQVAPQFGATMRQVILSGGSARFIVAPDPRRPLVIEAPGARVTAREGVVDIDLTERGVRVAAISGTPEVSFIPEPSETAPRLGLAQGEAVSAQERTPMRAPQAQASRVTIIEADGLPLADVLRIANGDGGTPIELDDRALGDRRVTGRFAIGDHAALARKLAAALDLGLVERDGRLLLSR